MSLEIVLIPMAIAIVTAAKTKQKGKVENSQFQIVETRMKNMPLLKRAMENVGCKVALVAGGMNVKFGEDSFDFKKNVDDIWVARFSPNIEESRATTLLSQIDKAYGLEVQRELIEKIRSRAAGVGMSLENETTNEDSSVTMTLIVNESS